jgi:dTDP-glucose 4,6-dehydratase
VRALLVSGGAGFIGANFVTYWLDAHPGDRVLVLDALTYAGNRASLREADGRAGFEFVQGDICDADLVATLLRDRAITTIVHFAAESHVDRSIAAPEEFLRTNVIGTQKLLQAARAVWMPEGRLRDGVRFHHISTDEVYGSLGAGEPAFTEATSYAPNSPYAASKAASDHLVRAYHHTYGLPVTTSNCSNNYGPYQFPEKLIPLMIVNALQGKPLPVYGDGGHVRDWLYVADHCRAIERVLLDGRVGESYNVGGRNQWRNLDVVRLLCEILDQELAADRGLAARFPQSPAVRGGRSAELLTFVRDRPGHDRRYAVDCTKVERELGFRPGESFETGLRKTVAWYLEHEEWWRGVMDGSYRAWMRHQYGEPQAGTGPYAGEE